MQECLNFNIGHGHVWPRPDGMKARCGGPRLCVDCARDYANKYGGVEVPEGPKGEEVKVSTEHEPEPLGTAIDIIEWEERLKIERSELALRLSRMATFRTTAAYLGMRGEPRDLLDAQYVLMHRLLDVLDRRLALVAADRVVRV